MSNVVALANCLAAVPQDVLLLRCHVAWPP
jgi:hypothetical protein